MSKTSIALPFFIISSLSLLSSEASSIQDKKSTDFIKSSCGATTYPGLCFNSLSSHASTIQTSPMQLAEAALSVSLEGARSTSAMMSTLSTGGRRGMVRGEVSAMRDCVEQMGDSVDELRRSMGEMGQLSGGDVGLKINDIQTWVSAAITNEDTCMDGFDGMPGTARNAVRAKILNVAQLTSNALALINKLAATIHATNP